MLVVVLPLLLLTILSGITYCGWLIFRRDPDAEAQRHADVRRQQALKKGASARSRDILQTRDPLDGPLA